MQQSDRNLLFNVSYHLDTRRRIKGANDQLYVVFTHEELEKLAGDLRIIAERDGQQIITNISNEKKKKK